MAHYTRALSYRFPLLRGHDVLALQLRLIELGFASLGHPDGLFGRRTERTVRAFQQDRGLKVDGIVGPVTWVQLFGDRPQTDPFRKAELALDELTHPHGFRDSCRWELTPTGIRIDGEEPETYGGEPKTIRKVWANFGGSVEKWAGKLGVPVELILATICTETRGDPNAVREEPGYVSDERTPHRVSPGLMQTLISTAASVLGEDERVSRDWLLQPDNSIRAGTAYIAQQWKVTGFDPPKVACAYNAGSVYYNDGEENRWRMRQYPINTGHHADRFVKWFNECFVMFALDDVVPRHSFYRMLHEEPAVVEG